MPMRAHTCDNGADTILMSLMRTSLAIDFVSDVSCPWCVIGLYAQEQAIERLDPGVSVTIPVEAFERALRHALAQP